METNKEIQELGKQLSATKEEDVDRLKSIVDRLNFILSARAAQQLRISFNITATDQGTVEKAIVKAINLLGFRYVLSGGCTEYERELFYERDLCPSEE